MPSQASRPHHRNTQCQDPLENHPSSCLWDVLFTPGVKKECEKVETELLGEIPIDIEIRKAGDEGIPVVAKDSDSPQSNAFMKIARNIKEKLNTK